YERGDFPVAESFADTAVSLPIYPGLTKRQIEYICETVREFCGQQTPVG
ncbi:DegT/DnrJ/EryC1/StrS family aminotransferase, partial [Candidatus Sumerlaeota bacterium]|nr:DegT/DnrJ/EryC1/StrS family aminotransferase [Candidatus Sumerlaeota bacterium]